MKTFALTLLALLAFTFTASAQDIPCPEFDNTNGLTTFEDYSVIFEDETGSIDRVCFIKSHDKMSGTVTFKNMLTLYSDYPISMIIMNETEGQKDWGGFFQFVRKTPTFVPQDVKIWYSGLENGITIFEDVRFNISDDVYAGYAYYNENNFELDRHLLNLINVYDIEEAYIDIGEGPIKMDKQSRFSLLQTYMVLVDKKSDLK